LIITFLPLALALRFICRVCPSIFNCQRPQISKTDCKSAWNFALSRKWR
jgi:hypothetical protein